MTSTERSRLIDIKLWLKWNNILRRYKDLAVSKHQTNTKLTFVVDIGQAGKLIADLITYDYDKGGCRHHINMIDAVFGDLYRWITFCHLILCIHWWSGDVTHHGSSTRQTSQTLPRWRHNGFESNLQFIKFAWAVRNYKYHLQR